MEAAVGKARLTLPKHDRRDLVARRARVSIVRCLRADGTDADARGGALRMRTVGHLLDTHKRRAEDIAPPATV